MYFYLFFYLYSINYTLFYLQNETNVLIFYIENSWRYLMNRDKVKVLIISVVIISFTILVFLGGIKLYNNSYSNFKLNGYIIASKNDTKSERYYFNENQKYKKTVNKNVVFETTSKISVSVLENSFVHYDNNSISTLKKAAILNLDNIDDKTIKYYNLYEGSILNKSNDTYSFTNSGKRTSLKNMIVKISSNKYLIENLIHKRRFS